MVLRTLWDGGAQNHPGAAEAFAIMGGIMNSKHCEYIARVLTGDSDQLNISMKHRMPCNAQLGVS
jgi:hypothetical protein